MKIIKEGIKSYPQDPTRYFDFSKYESLSKDFYLVEGYIDFEILYKYKDKKIVYLEFEDPNRFWVEEPQFNHYKYDHLFYKVFTISAETARWLNLKSKSKKYVSTFFPFNKKYIPHNKDKVFDIIYTGHINSKEIENNLKEISNYDYRFVSNSDSMYVTNKSVSYESKLDLISKSKITLVHNLLFADQEKARVIKKIRNYQFNSAFSEIYKYRYNPFIKEILVPHLKSRTFEAAFSKSLILCRKDPFNIIEQYFTPNIDFVYYEQGHLKEAIDKILSNYGEYTTLIESAYSKAVKNYGTDSFFKKYLSRIE